METIELLVRARHFKQAVFSNPCSCGLANAAKDLFKENKLTDVMEGVDNIFIIDAFYEHDDYGQDDFKSDYAKAIALNFSDEIIRTITLTKS